MYIIQEMQANAAGEPVAFLPAEQRATREEAESVFYFKCGSACVSAVPIHTVMTFTEEGFPIAELTKCFKHPAQNEEPQG